MTPPIEPRPGQSQPATGAHLAKPRCIVRLERTRPLVVCVLLGLLTACQAPAQDYPVPPPCAPAQRSASQLDSLVQPIAAYSDHLVGVILPASVYPLVTLSATATGEQIIKVAPNTGALAGTAPAATTSPATYTPPPTYSAPPPGSSSGARSAAGLVVGVAATAAIVNNVDWDEEYVINGNMIGGFALVAWPAEHGESGIMTFIVNQQGRVHERDFGPKTAQTAPSLTSYDPDKSWAASVD